MSPSATRRCGDGRTPHASHAPRVPAAWLAAWVAATLAAACLLAPMGAAAQEAAPARVSVPLDLVIDGRYRGPINAEVVAGQVLVDRARLTDILAPSVDAAVLARLSGAGPIALADLAAAGIEAAYDPAELSVSLSIPVPLRRMTTLDVIAGPLAAGGQGAGSLPVETPAAFSGYLNVTASVDLLTGGFLPSPSPWAAPVTLALEPVLNVGGWVLEARGSLVVDAGLQAEVDLARLVKDFPASSVRIAAGSLFLPVTGFQSPFSLYGIEVLRDPAIFSATRPDPVAGSDFSFGLPGSVTVMLNGRAVRSFALEAGRYRIGSLPLETGLNRIHFDDPQPRDILLPYDSRLLPAGTTSYAAGLGVQAAGLASALPVSPIASAWIRHGFGSFLTAGADLQAGLDSGLGGLDLLAATPVGNFLLGAGLSLPWGAPPDAAGYLQYRLAFPGSPWLPAIGLEARYTGPAFGAPAAQVGSTAPVTAAVSPYSWQLGAALSQALPLGFGLSLGLGFRLGWAPQPDSVAATLALSRAVGRGAALTLLVTAEAERGGSPAVTASLGLTASAPDGSRSGSIASGLTAGSTSVDLRLQPSSTAPIVSASLADVGAATGTSGSLGVQYTNALLETSLVDSFAGLGAAPGYPSGAGNRLTLTAGMAVATAGGVVALSRPIVDSFAIVVPVESLGDQRVEAVSSAGGGSAVARPGSLGVLPALLQYQQASVSLVAPDAPAGAEVGPGTRVLAPTYRSGIAVRVGTPATVYVESTLLAPDGAALAFRSGAVAPAGLPTPAAPVPFFTDERGVFQAYGLTPGAWTVTVDGPEGWQGSFVVPPGVSGLYRPDPLRLSPSKGGE